MLLNAVAQRWRISLKSFSIIVLIIGTTYEKYQEIKYPNLSEEDQSVLGDYQVV